MSSRCRDFLDAREGVATRADLVASVGPDAVDWAVSSGQVARPLPRTLLLPDATEGAVTARRERAAALAYAGAGAALSHLTALELWQLPVPELQQTHVLVAHARRPRRGTPSCPTPDLGARLVLHRSRHDPVRLTRGDLAVVTLERAVVESWPLLRADEARAPVLVAVRARRTTTHRLRRQLREHPRLRGRRALHELLDLIEDGCHSELELWGHRFVFTGPACGGFDRQVPMKLLGRSAYLDMFDAEAQLDIELDGRKYHSTPRQREADLARDAAAAEEGIQTLRFSHERLTSDPAGCRRQALAVRARRLLQLHGRASTIWGRSTRDQVTTARWSVPRSLQGRLRWSTGVDPAITGEPPEEQDELWSSVEPDGYGP